MAALASINNNNQLYIINLNKTEKGLKQSDFHSFSFLIYSYFTRPWADNQLSKKFHYRFFDMGFSTENYFTTVLVA